MCSSCHRGSSLTKWKGYLEDCLLMPFYLFILPQCIHATQPSANFWSRKKSQSLADRLGRNPLGLPKGILYLDMWGCRYSSWIEHLPIIFKALGSILVHWGPHSLLWSWIGWKLGWFWVQNFFFSTLKGEDSGELVSSWMTYFDTCIYDIQNIMYNLSQN